MNDPHDPAEETPQPVASSLSDAPIDTPVRYLVIDIGGTSQGEFTHEEDAEATALTLARQNRGRYFAVRRPDGSLGRVEVMPYSDPAEPEEPARSGLRKFLGF